MMRIYSVSVGNKIRKGLTVKRQKDSLRFISFDKKSKKIFLSRFFPDLIYTTTVLPPVNDPETLEFLIKTRVRGLLQEEVEYAFLYFPEEKVSETEISYNVYAIPQSLYFQSAQLINAKPEDIELFTVDIFSLIPISKKLSGGHVFHFYADEEKIIITVSKEDKPLFSRSISIADSMQTASYTNFLYEHFNLTYMYVYQNKKIDISTVVVSGKASHNRELLGLIKELTDKEPLIPEGNRFIQNLSQKEFMEFFIPIGTALLDEQYDFSPFPLKKKKFLNKILKVLSVVFFFLALVGSVVVLQEVSKYREKQHRIENIFKKINRVEKEIKGMFSSPDEVDFYKKVFLLKKKAEKSNPLYVFNDIYPLLELLDEKRIELFNKTDLQIVHITAVHHFDNISEMVDFKERLFQLLNKMRNKGFDVESNVRRGKEGFSLEVSLELKRRLNGNQ